MESKKNQHRVKKEINQEMKEILVLIMNIKLFINQKIK